MSLTLGIRVKSGWGAAVLLGGSPELPTLLDSCRLELADPETPASVQPYHAGAGTPRTEQQGLARLLALVERISASNVAALLGRYGAADRMPSKAVVIGTSAADPGKLTNPHIRIHALEGQLFRRVTREALTALGIPCAVQLERELFAQAPERLGRPALRVQRELRELGKTAAGPWRAEYKSAALGAWLLLKGTP